MGAPVNPNGGGRQFGGGGSGIGQGGGKGKTSSAGSPGLITSTGGLNGSAGLLMAPAYNIYTQKSFIVVFDATDYNCEEAATYYFRQEANFEKCPGEGRQCTIHRIVMKYKELGAVTFSINITVFNTATDDFATISIPVSLPFIPVSKMSKNRKNTFPDKKIHTAILTPPNGVVQGERPQLSITTNGKTGPLSITKLVMCGNADEVAQN